LFFNIFPRELCSTTVSIKKTENYQNYSWDLYEKTIEVRDLAM